jgi:SAM-dependent methyltransferase
VSDVQRGADFWEDFYAHGDRWSGRANELLVAEIDGMAPGHALDLGCGEGGDAIWLAEQGWRVTAVDIAASALAAAARHAEAAGVGAAITWARHDLEDSLPTGPFDLVTCCYLHSNLPLERDRILRAAATLVGPGGTLVVVSHAGPPSWTDGDGHPGHAGHAGPAGHFARAADVTSALDLGAGWTVVRSADVARPGTAPDGSPGTRPDSVVRACRS